MQIVTYSNDIKFYLNDIICTISNNNGNLLKLFTTLTFSQNDNFQTIQNILDDISVCNTNTLNVDIQNYITKFIEYYSYVIDPNNIDDKIHKKKYSSLFECFKIVNK
jgi:hypothetical protein